MLQEVKVGYERGLGERKRTHKDFAVGYLWVVFRRTVFGVVIRIDLAVLSYGRRVRK